MFILRGIQIKFRTKVALGLCLCMSIVVMIISIIQVAGIRVPGRSKLDLVWVVYWQMIEALVAIIIVCLTAFRSFFIQNRSRNQSPPKKPWYSGIRAVWGNKSSGVTTEEQHELPQIPGGTLTGMRTFIDGNGRDTALRGDDDTWPLRPSASGHDCQIQQNLSTR